MENLIYIFTILLTINGIFLIWNIFYFFNNKKLKIEKNKKQEQYNKQLQRNIKELQIKKQQLITNFQTNKNQLEDKIKNYEIIRKKEIQQHLTTQQKLSQQKLQNYNNKIKEKIEISKQKIQEIEKDFQKQKQEILNQLDKLRSSLKASIEAKLREQQKKDKINFYKLILDEIDLVDIEKLENLKLSLHKPIILSKLIWTQYFQKQMTELCDRVLGKKNKSGIYKITNILTDQCYIGQSTDIATRWKAHCKCGLGIDAPATNTLYNNMQKYKVWNFTFELLEQCPKEQLNEKQRFWIDFYSSNIYGLNKTKGNK